MSRSIPVTLAALAALLAGASTSLAPGPSRAAPADAWTGSATCTLTTTGPFSYQNQQVHTWKISPGAAQTQNGAARLYAYTWRDTGRGTRAGTVRWEIDGRGAGNIAFRTNQLNGALYIGIQGGAGVDSQGIRVIDTTGGNTRTYPAPAYEWPFSLITVRAGSTSVVAAPHPVPVNGSVGFQQTGGSKTDAVCSWNFQFGA